MRSKRVVNEVAIRWWSSVQLATNRRSAGPRVYSR